ncbi:hypothetical protein JTB14_037257 [Gonioctena quinquepunctata]|nr:hypothetical protein JTB14_037257 [Gonioctena quinquepunctata]
MVRHKWIYSTFIHKLRSIFDRTLPKHFDEVYVILNFRKVSPQNHIRVPRTVNRGVGVRHHEKSPSVAAASPGQDMEAPLGVTLSQSMDSVNTNNGEEEVSEKYLRFV